MRRKPKINQKRIVLIARVIQIQRKNYRMIYRNGVGHRFVLITLQRLDRRRLRVTLVHDNEERMKWTEFFRLSR